ncbi:S-adenosyl-L-methionine-dependent methyltransferase, partial [Punctularia strigosozonata HHB-11173 SS5]|uniref:S-adenosyl-L-methionine-dependent methyltransferase n=1 Tax=Punctularia strigosozonata (strain HHB-11173) TaxID=741275 RepID=UPI00044170DC
MQDAGLLKVTHAIEILPSACQTIRANSPQTIVYNQCANEMLRYTADMLNEAEPCREDAPRQIHPPELLPKPPLPGDIDVILAGFPCQSHSALNMYRKEDDPRSRLMLTMLSFVHVYQPKYCVFENVPGFLEYDPGAGQEDPEHNKMGGLRLLYHALTTMSYQVRCGVLQAGNYGAPQHRQR